VVEHGLDPGQALSSRLPDADGSYSVIFVARVDDFTLEARSGPLKIPLGAFVFSS